MRRRCKRLPVVCVAWCLMAGSVLVANGFSNEHGVVLTEAKTLLAEGAWVLAQARLESILRQTGLDVSTRRDASFLLSQAFLKTGNAARVEESLKDWSNDPEALGLRAQASLQLGFWHEAAERFLWARKGGADVVSSVLGRAEALSKGGQVALAMQELEGLLVEKKGGNPVRFAALGLRLDLGQLEKATQEWRSLAPQTPLEKSAAQYFEGRILLAQQRGTEAVAKFSALLGSGVEISSAVFVGAALGQADGLVLQGNADGAVKFLAQVLRSDRELPEIEAVFQRLAELSGDSRIELDDMLRDLTRSGAPQRRALARFYLAQIYFNSGKFSKASEELHQFCQDFPKHPLAAQAFLQRAEVEMSEKRWGNAGKLLREALENSRDPLIWTQIQFREAVRLLQVEKFVEALSVLDSLPTTDVGLVPKIAFNSGLAALRLGNVRRAQSELKRLLSVVGGDGLASEMELEIALQLIRDGNSKAEENLHRFIQSHPDHIRVGDARVALAELYFRDSQAVTKEAKGGVLRGKAGEFLQLVSGDAQSPRAASQAEYLAVFLADAANPRDEIKVLELGEAFLRDHADSPLLPEMRMKLGEVYFRRKDYANAETQFASVAKEQPEGPLVWPALYLAGQCASGLLNPGSVDRALGYWDQVVRGGGPLHWEARYQQAAVKSRLGEETEGIVLFDLILTAPSGVSAELRYSAQCGKADALLALSRRSGGKNEAALLEYKRLAETENVPPVWRNQALYKMGKALEGRGDLEALSVYYKVLDAPGASEAGEFFWLFKAGFDAARILEGKTQWADAVALYERLGKMGGPRSREAKERARQLRLEHFLWE